MKYQLGPAQMTSKVCSHQKFTRPVEVGEKVCRQCLEQGDEWVELRVCLTCGHVGCCDSSKNRHATHHCDDEGHPIVMSLAPGAAWAWCYVDQTYL